MQIMKMGVLLLKGTVAIRRVFSLVVTITKTKFSNCLGEEDIKHLTKVGTFCEMAVLIVHQL